MRNRNLLLAGLFFLLCSLPRPAHSQGLKPPGTPTTETYTIKFSGTGSAHVTSSPAGIDCPGSACTYTWPRTPTQQLWLTAAPDPNTLTSLGCTGTAPHVAGKTTSCNMGPMYGGNVVLTVYLWQKGSPPPGPQPDAITH
jgi:hypothetical protein